MTRDDTQHEKCMTLIHKENIKFEYKYLKNLIKLDFKMISIQYIFQIFKKILIFLMSMWRQGFVIKEIML